jgi:hypothetical protein
MEMQIPQLRILFESRVGSISTIFAKTPPKELGDIEPTIRVLKGFLFALEGMYRSNYLVGLPFTAIQELHDRVDRAAAAIKALPEKIDREQAMGILSVVDSLHRLCLQENLMAGGMDASKLGKLTIILERKLGDVLETIDTVAGTVAGAADGHTGVIEQAVGKCLTDIQGLYTSETEVLHSSASLAAESITSQTEAICKRQTEAIEAFDTLQQEIDDKRQEFQERLDEQLSAAKSMVDEAKGRQESIADVVAVAGKQLSQAQTAIQAMAEITQATEEAGEDLEGKLAEGKEIITSIREFMKSGRRDAADISAQLAEAQQSQANLEQMQQECAEFTAEARQKQAEALEAAKVTATAAEQILTEAKQKLNSQFQASVEKMQIESAAYAAEAQQKQNETLAATMETTAAAEQMLDETTQTLASQSQARIDQLQRDCDKETARTKQTQAAAAEATLKSADAFEQSLGETRQKLDSQAQASIEQMQQECDNFTAETQQKQTAAAETATETTAAFERMLDETGQQLDSQSHASIRKMQQDSARFTDETQQMQTETSAAATETLAALEQALSKTRQKLNSQSKASIEQMQQDSADFTADAQQKQAAAAATATTTTAAFEQALSDTKQKLNSKSQATIQKMRQDCAEITEESRQTQTEAMASAIERSAAFEQTLSETTQNLDSISQATIQQMQQDCAKITEEARQTQTEAIATATGKSAAFEQTLSETTQNLDSKSQATIQQMQQDCAEITKEARQTQTEAMATATERSAAFEQTLSETTQNLDSEAQAFLGQMQTERTEFTTEAQRIQTEATNAADAISTDAELMLHEAQQKLDSQFQTSGRSLTKIKSRGVATAEALAETQKKQQAATQSAHEAKENCKKAEKRLSKIEGMLAKSTQAGERIDQLVQDGCDLKTRMEQTLSEAGQERQQIALLLTESTEATIAIRRGKEEALDAVRQTLSDTDHQLRQFTQTVSEQRESAQEAVAGLRSDQTIAAELLGRTQQDVETLQGEIATIHELRSSASDTEAQIRAKLDQAGGVSDNLDVVLLEADELKTKVDTNLTGSIEARQRIEQIEKDTGKSAGTLLAGQEEALAIMNGEAEAAGVHRQACEASCTEQLEAAQNMVLDLGTYKSNADNLLEQTQQQRDAAHQAGQETAQVRVESAEAGGEIQAKLQEARGAAADLVGLLSAGTESRSKIAAELTAATQTTNQINDTRQEMTQALDQSKQNMSDTLKKAKQDMNHTFEEAKQQKKQMDSFQAQSEKIIADITAGGQKAIDNLESQTSGLVERNEHLQQEIEDLFGHAADGGLFRQFDNLAEQSAPKRKKWLRLLLASGIGGGGGIATVAVILTSVSVWASAAVLIAGLTPLAFFMYFCVSQYNAERRDETQHQYRAALSRSITAYRKLLAAMKAEGIADSPFVDSMLSTLFGAATDQNKMPQLTPVAADSEQETE